MLLRHLAIAASFAAALSATTGSDVTHAVAADAVASRADAAHSARTHAHAHAHAMRHLRLVASSPAADSRSGEAPSTLTLTFSESPELALTRVTLRRGDAAVRLGALTRAEGDARTVAARVPQALAPGRYTVRWQVTGADGHPVRGDFGFEVLPAGAVRAGDTAAPDATQPAT